MARRHQGPTSTRRTSIPQRPPAAMARAIAGRIARERLEGRPPRRQPATTRRARAQTVRDWTVREKNATWTWHPLSITPKQIRSTSKAGSTGESAMARAARENRSRVPLRASKAARSGRVADTSRPSPLCHLDTSTPCNLAFYPRAQKQLPFGCALTIPRNPVIPCLASTSRRFLVAHIPRLCAQARYILPSVAARRIPTGRAESCSGRGPSQSPGGPARGSAAAGPACGRGQCDSTRTARHFARESFPSLPNSADHHSCPKGKPSSYE